jgi:hypothetical protein
MLLTLEIMVVGWAEGQQLSSIIKALETQTQELKSALAGMKDVVHGSDTISHLRSDSPS